MIGGGGGVIYPVLPNYCPSTLTKTAISGIILDFILCDHPLVTIRR
jgi:hypothetical protein